MIVPVTNKARDVNIALVHIANINNKDIDEMKQRTTDVGNQLEELESVYKKQTQRWRNYRTAYEAIIIQFEAAISTIGEDELAQLLPGYGD